MIIIIGNCHRILSLCKKENMAFLLRLQACFVAGILLFAGLSSGCKNTSSQSTTNDMAAKVILPEEKDNDTAETILMPADSADQVYQGLRWQASVLNFYASRHFEPAWMAGNNDGIPCDSMLSILKNIRYYGLFPQDYHHNELEAELNSSSALNRLPRVDALLTDAFFSVANDLKYGRNYISSITPSAPVYLLQESINKCALKQTLAAVEPDFQQYRALKEALKIALDTVKQDDREELLNGVDLRSTPEHIKNIEINLERWRWENISFGHHYLLINIPSYTLELFKNDTVVLESKVIVGKPDTPTPLLSSSIECFIIYPYWHVPRKIATEEYLPMLKKNRSVISRYRFEVLNRQGVVLDPDTIEWKKYSKDNFPFILRQTEGIHNALGLIKFDFENPYAVFLHDTNAPYLFKNKRRAFSHGCIRMEKAVELGHYLATGEVNKKSDMVTEYLLKQQRQIINLANPVPIHVRYFTAEYKNRQLYQYPDIYSRDHNLIHLLYESRRKYQ